MTATVTGGATGGTPATASPAPSRKAPRRRRLGLPRASTPPGQVRLIRVGLVVLRLGWGALAALMAGQHASAAHDATATSEPLSLDAQQMYQSLADADVTVSTGYLYGRVPPAADRQRYQQDIAVATADLKAVTAASGESPGIGKEPDTAGALFGHLEDDLGAAIRAGQAAFAGSAAAGSGAFTGLEAGVAVLALAMAAGCAWGLSQRLAEYR